MLHLLVILAIVQAICGFAVPPEALQDGEAQIDGPVPSTPPTWGFRYMVTGTLRLPYTEIEEPFTGWYDEYKNRSRIDYYGGMDQTVQRGDLGLAGQTFKISPMTNEVVLNKKSCFQVNGTKLAKVIGQATLPLTAQFKFQRYTVRAGHYVEEWRYVHTVGTKVNTYTLHVSKDTREPKFYEMMGYDSLFGSHYDKYTITYDTYATKFDDSVFDAPIKGIKCGGFPGPGHEGRILSNPMQEYMHPTNEDHLFPMFNDFATKYGKDYINRGSDEFNKRQHNFRQNLRFIHSINRKGLTYKVKINHLADQTKEELKRLRGKKKSDGKYNGGQEFKPDKLRPEDVPSSYNWRLYGAVTPVKDQAVCGSCWSFGTTGTIEGALFLKTGRLVRLSQQNLMDCSWGFGNNGCDGGEDFRSYQWIMKHGGIATEDSYGPYLGANGYCHFKKDDIVIGAKLKGYVNVTSGDQNALKIAIFTKGPISVGIDAAHLSLSFYSHGVYYEPKCGNTVNSLDHAVLAVGYGVLYGTPYWLIKNSWSTHWGNDGYVLMSQKDNNCGVATAASFVIL